MQISPMPDQRLNTYSKGLQGEATAEAYLCKTGMICLERRYRSPYGEIDLIMLDGEALAFVEVKARNLSTLHAAQMSVTPAKQRRIIQTALCFLNEHPEHAQRLMRFDIVSLSGDCIQHLPNAFQGAGW